MVPPPGSVRASDRSPAERHPAVRTAAPGAAIARPRARARTRALTRAGRTVWLAGLVVAGTIGGACATPGGDPGTQVAREPSLDDAVLDWGDDLDHVVVYAAPPEVGTGAEAVGSATEPQTGPARDGHTSLPPDDQTYLLAALDGTTRPVTVAEGSLVAVMAATAHEADVLGEVRTTSPVALIVADPHGVVGRPGGRYVLDVDHLVELPPPDDPPSPPPGKVIGWPLPGP